MGFQPVLLFVFFGGRVGDPFYVVTAWESRATVRRLRKAVLRADGLGKPCYVNSVTVRHGLTTSLLVWKAGGDTIFGCLSSDSIRL